MTQQEDLCTECCRAMFLFLLPAPSDKIVLAKLRHLSKSTLHFLPEKFFFVTRIALLATTVNLLPQKKKKRDWSTNTCRSKKRILWQRRKRRYFENMKTNEKMFLRPFRKKNNNNNNSNNNTSKIAPWVLHNSFSFFKNGKRAWKLFFNTDLN